MQISLLHTHYINYSANVDNINIENDVRIHYVLNEKGAPTIMRCKLHCNRYCENVSKLRTVV